MLAVVENLPERKPAKRVQFMNGNGQRSSPLKDAVEFQRRIVELAKDPDITPSELAKLTRAYKEQEELKREIRGLGRPGLVTPKNATPKGKSKPDPAKFTEPQ